MSIPEIAECAGLHRATVIEALGWLEEKGYLYGRKNGRTATTYTVVLRRDEFLKTDAREGRAAATDEYEAWLADLSEEARAALAEKRGER